MRDFLEHARSIHTDLVALRRDLHRHPELAFREVRTSRVAATAVEAAGFRARRIGQTGVVAELVAGDGPTVALRADMDALPVTEASEVEYRSAADGVMHACGHDAHTAMLVGAARVLAAAHGAGALPPATYRLLFQPAEEQADAQNRSGARHLVAGGAMDGVAAIFALHVAPHLPAGRVFTREGALMGGGDTFTADVLGSASHGARPDRGVDAVVLAAHVVLAAQLGVARRIPPLSPGVITFGSVRGGSAANVVADRVGLEGTLRYLEADTRARLREALADALRVADTLGGGHVLELRDGYPPTINDPGMARLAVEAARATLGPDGAGDIEPSLATEDFSILLEHAPGALLWLGAAPESGPRELHRPDMDIDEGVLPVGAAVLAACAARAAVSR